MLNVEALTIGSLFSGVGLLDLAVELVTGGRLLYQCEKDPWRRRVLERHWPGVLRSDDVCTFHPPKVDLICGGFPCQDLSVAGLGAGLDGERSGLFFEYARILEETEPAFAFIENVGALEKRGLDRVLARLDRLGYQTRRGRLAARDIGAPHGRDRMWILAFRDDADRRALAHAICVPGDADELRQAQPNADPARDHRARRLDGPDDRRAVADADADRRQGRGTPHHDDGRDAPGHDDDRRRAALLLARPDWPPGWICSPECRDGRCDPEQHRRWSVAWVEWIARNPGCEPGLRRADHGSAGRLVDRSKRAAALGDGVCVPQAAAALVGLLTGDPVPTQIGLWTPTE